MSRKAFNTRWAQGVETQDSSTVFQEPDNIRLTTGWEGGADKDSPPAGQENWWHNRVDSALQGVERTGVMAYHSQAIYSIGAPTYATDGNYYESLASGNTGNDPVSTSGFWRFIGSSFFAGLDPGDIKAVAHNGVPSQGWLKCNGSVISRASYLRLFSTIGTIWNTGGETSLQFRLPDFRGEFLRGFDDGRGVDTSRSFASSQMGQLERHDHFLPTNGAGLNFTQPTIPDNLWDLTHEANPSPTTTTVATTYLDYGPRGSFGAETRPRNKTVNYWIKY